MKKAYIEVDKITEAEIISGAKVELTTKYQGELKTEIIDINSNDLVDIKIWDNVTKKLVAAKTPRIALFSSFYDTEIGDKYEIGKTIIEPKFKDNILVVAPKIKSKNEQGEIVYTPILSDFSYVLNIIVGRLTHTSLNFDIIDGQPLRQEQIDAATEAGVTLSNNGAANNIHITSNFDFSINIIKDDVIWDNTHGFSDGTLTVIK